MPPRWPTESDTRRVPTGDLPPIRRAIQEHGIYLDQANISRRAGLNNLRQYLAWRGPDGKDGTPALRFMRTEGNSWLFDQLETMVCDPNDPEDALKLNANRDTGEGGDDGYDCLRYAMASRPPPAVPLRDEEPFDAWSREALEHEMRPKIRRLACPAKATPKRGRLQWSQLTPPAAALRLI